MQVARFNGGGFVVHKIANGAGRASAWFNEAGLLIDLEAFDRIGRHSKPSQALRAECSRLGQRYKATTGS